jgi:hypothetical protein
MQPPSDIVEKENLERVLSNVNRAQMKKGTPSNLLVSALFSSIS